MAHLWQRFLLTCALVAGLAIGVAATVFGYSNLGTVDVHWSVFHVAGVPLWAVAIVPLVVVLVLGTVYHWLDGLHHFTEHMRHRHRVRELEAEIQRLREHLDHVLEMPRGDMTATAAPAVEEAPETPSLPAASDSLTASADEAFAGLEADGDGSDLTEPAEPAPVTAADEVRAEAPAKKPSSDRKKRSRIIMESAPEPASTNGADAEPVATASEARSD